MANVNADLVSGCVRRTQELRFVLFTFCTVRKLKMSRTKIKAGVLVDDLEAKDEFEAFKGYEMLDKILE